MEFILQIVDLFASQYGWTRDYILDNVYIDEYFIQRDIIDKRQRQEIMMKSQIILLPHIEDKHRKEFLRNLEGEDRNTLIGKNIQTDYEAIKKAKQMLNI